jgi:CBS domain-containing protein
MSVGRICIRDVDLADPEESVQTAARRMNDRKVGTLIVKGADGGPIGILTDRDLAIRVVGEGQDPRKVLVADVMTKAPDSVQEDTPIETALSRMRAGPYRRLPVVDGSGQLAGLISLDDILDLLAEEFRQVGDLIRRESPSSLANL